MHEQLGMVRRDQVVGVVVSDGALKWLLHTGQWRVVLPSVYAVAGGALTDEQRLVAAGLYCGESAQVTGPAALRIHGVRYGPEDHRVHMLTSHRRHLSSTGFVVVHRTRRPDPQPVRRGRLAVVSIARAVADTARTCDDLRAVRAFVADVVQRRLATVAQLHVELELAKRNGTLLLRQALLDLGEGVRSAPEAALKDIFDASSVLVGTRWNPILVTASGEPLPTPDAWIDEVGIAVEVDSREHHSTPDGWARTLRRANRLARRGALVLHFTPAEIYVDPDAVRRTVVEAYLRRRDAGVRAAVRLHDQGLSAAS
jgi:hypothetical protein